MALSPPPRRLQRLVMPVGLFSRVPNWMGELNNLKELDINVIRCDVGVLAELAVLIHLNLYIKEILKETIVIYERPFPVLKSFELWLSSRSYLTSLHLKSFLHKLEEVCYRSELTSAESASRSAIDMHPSNPRVEIQFDRIFPLNSFHLMIHVPCLMIVIRATLMSTRKVAMQELVVGL